jgi:hypothetical protein
MYDPNQIGVETKDVLKYETSNMLENFPRNYFPA